MLPKLLHQTCWVCSRIWHRARVRDFSATFGSSSHTNVAATRQKLLDTCLPESLNVTILWAAKVKDCLWSSCVNDDLWLAKRLSPQASPPWTSKPMWLSARPNMKFLQAIVNVVGSACCFFTVASTIHHSFCSLSVGLCVCAVKFGYGTSVPIYVHVEQETIETTRIRFAVLRVGRNELTAR